LNAISRDRLESQREERELAETEKEQVYSEFDDELKTLQERINSLTQENEALRSENAGLHSKFGEMDKRPVLAMGDEGDLYPGEIKELVLSVLADELDRGVTKPSRRSDVFSDLIEKNDYNGVYRKKKAEIQIILKNYTIMDAKTRKALQEFGFRIEEDGKHYRLTFFGDDRYNTTVAKTPSDARAGKNIAHHIEQTMM
jgi:ribonuclease BN (tRNA processing enzyme)